ncbi:MAG: tetratricopeptide repeat protein [Tannerellaceae bacterium]|jgi:tetratricopeptide (TPR) repeat protein|nr:tetratricopeptide repeat protein [Tannerellaceae bacterium]
MGNFLKSLFSPATEKRDDNDKNFELFKYDGIRAQRMGKTDFAIRCFEEALKIRREPETASLLINAYLQNNQTDRALHVANRAVEADATNMHALLGRASILFQCERYDEALADCQIIFAADFPHPLVHLLAAKIKRALNDPEAALASLEEAVAKQDDLADARLLMAEIQFDLGRYDQAMLNAEKLVELAPDDELGFILKGKICEKNGKTNDALECYDRALSLDPYNRETALLAARALLRDGRAADAVTFLDDTIEMIADFAPAYKLRAEAKRLAGDPAGADADERAAAAIASEEAGGPGQVDFEEMNRGGIY